MSTKQRSVIFHLNHSTVSGQSTLITVFLLFFILSSIGAAGYFYFEKEKMGKLHSEKIELLNKKVVTLSEQLKERDLDNLKLKNSLENAEKDAQTYKTRFQELSDLQLTLTEIKSALTTEFSKVQQTLTSNFGKVDDFSRSFDSRIEEYFDKSQREFSRIVEKKKEEVKTVPKKPDNQVELPKIEVTGTTDKTAPQQHNPPPKILQEASQPETPVPSEKNAQAAAYEKQVNKLIKIMKVNQEHLFFVINKGLVDGMKVGQELAVYRHDIKIGKAAITEVRELISLAEIKEQYGGHFIEDGDTANLL